MVWGSGGSGWGMSGWGAGGGMGGGSGGRSQENCYRQKAMASVSLTYMSVASYQSLLL